MVDNINSPSPNESGLQVNVPTANATDLPSVTQADKSSHEIINTLVSVNNVLGSSINNTPSNYYIPASFIFYNVKILNKKTAFANFIKGLSYTDTVSSVSSKYKNAMGTSLSKAVENWEKWVLSVDKGSNIYMNW